MLRSFLRRFQKDIKELERIATLQRSEETYNYLYDEVSKNIKNHNLIIKESVGLYREHKHPVLSTLIKLHWNEKQLLIKHKKHIREMHKIEKSLLTS